MAHAIALLLVLLAVNASEALAEDRTGPSRRLRLAPSELSMTFGSAVPLVPRRIELAADGVLEDPADHKSGLPPFFTLMAPQSPSRDENGATEPPLFAFGARVQGRTLVAFTRPGTKTDPDDRVVYQRLVVSDLFAGRRFGVTVYEDHALSGSDSQVLGFGARLTLRPVIEIGGWRTRVELFTSYDLTLGLMGSIGITARAPAPPPVLSVLP